MSFVTCQYKFILVFKCLKTVSRNFYVSLGKEMLFPSNFSKKLRSNGRRFTLQKILEIPKETIGVYIFHYNHVFVYVGQSIGVQERLRQHYDNRSHNEELSLWVKALDGDVQFTYLRCEEIEIDDLEKSLILYLQPRTNKDRYIGYTPKPTNWRKAHG